VAVIHQAVRKEVHKIPILIQTTHPKPCRLVATPSSSD
jgi:hypothetical protein